MAAIASTSPVWAFASRSSYSERLAASWSTLDKPDSGPVIRFVAYSLSRLAASKSFSALASFSRSASSCVSRSLFCSSMRDCSTSKIDFSSSMILPIAASRSCTSVILVRLLRTTSNWNSRPELSFRCSAAHAEAVPTLDQASPTLVAAFSAAACRFSTATT